jgi:DNA (cytosine-5)-methyltransferase 1
MKLRALDLFCCAGGATRGLQMAGFHVTGVDIKPSIRYCGDAFICADAMTVDLRGYDYIWASPPCQKYCRLTQGLSASRGHEKDHPDLVDPVRQRLIDAGVPWTIENVVGSPLRNPVKLCGSSFGLLVERHRLFESSFMVIGLPCSHHTQAGGLPALHRHSKNKASRVVGCYGGGRGKGDNHALWSKAMGIDWMTRREMAQAIPPVYAEYIGRFAAQAALQASLPQQV